MLRNFIQALQLDVWHSKLKQTECCGKIKITIGLLITLKSRLAC